MNAYINNKSVVLELFEPCLSFSLRQSRMSFKNVSGVKYIIIFNNKLSCISQSSKN